MDRGGQCRRREASTSTRRSPGGAVWSFGCRASSFELIRPTSCHAKAKRSSSTRFLERRHAAPQTADLIVS
jgi:hypothetical protein